MSSRNALFASKSFQNIDSLQQSEVSLKNIVDLRGGSESDFDDEYASDEMKSLDDSSASSSMASTLTKTVLKGIVSIAKASVRALSAAFQASEAPDDNSDLETSLVGMIGNTLGRMWNAAFFPDTSVDNNQQTDEKVDDQRPVKSPRQSRDTMKSHDEPTRRQHNKDIGDYLAQTYNVARESSHDAVTVLGGSLTDALQVARRQGRMLVLVLPSSAPKKASRDDKVAIESFLSQDVAIICNKKSRKGASTSSFSLWSAKQGSPEATQAIRRLKLQQEAGGAKKGKRPILAVVYPALSSTGKVAPRLLAQHHASPPPVAATMAAWLNALRKRHAKQYQVMQMQLKELELYKERKAGYQESIQSDKERQAREKQEEQEREAAKKAKEESQAATQQRRQEVLNNMEEEPGATDPDAMTLALRFADGGAAQRRFPKTASLEAVFDWIDAKFELNRDDILLTTMKGKSTFTFAESADVTLEDSGLPRKVGVRVSLRAKSTAS